jgi:putative ABC transport system permease protein
VSVRRIARAAIEPPRLALRLLQRALPALAQSEREALIGDLLEEFREDAARYGPRRARLRFWRETVSAIAALRPRLRPRPHQPASGDPPVHAFLADLRHGARVLSRAPAFTVLSVLTLGLGIGATTAVFSIVNPVLLRTLPYPQSDRIVLVNERDADGQPTTTGFATFADVARESRTLERVGVLSDWAPTISSGVGADAEVAELLTGDRISWSYFRVFGVQPILGRDFVASDDTPANKNVVILSHGLWARRFASDPGIVGRSILLDGSPMTVVGVMPASFDHVLSHAQIWRVLGYSAEQPWACRTCRHLSMVARLRPGVARETAAAELDGISRRLVADYPKEYSAAGMFVTPLQEVVTKAVRPALFAVLGAAVLLLLIACANVVNLQLARAVRRADEFAIRVALGAGRARLAQQLVAEGLVLALLGGVAGVLVARLALPALVARLPERLPRLEAVRLDLAVLGVTAALTISLGILIGLAPAWQGGRRAIAGALRGRSGFGGPSHRVARAGLVVAEVALALMLLAGAGLVARSLVRLLSVDAGFDPRKVLTLQLQSTGPRYHEDAAVYAYHDRVRDAVRALPGVSGVGLASQLPLGGNIDRYGVRAQDKPLENPELAPSGDRYVVSADYLRTMRIPIVGGRAFTDADAADSAAPVAIVSAELASRIWPGEDALGKRIQLGETTSPWRTVVGVAANVRHSGLDAAVTQQFYIPERQWPWSDGQMILVIRTHHEPAALAAAVRRVVTSIDPTQPIAHLATMDQVIATSTAQRQLALTLFAAFGIAAVLLAAFGIYGVLAGSVAERTPEIGLRTALGATPGDIIAMVLRQGARLAALGVVLGLAGALALTRFLRTLLFGIAPSDPATLGGVVVVLVAVAIAACLVPARRAVRVDPITALRAE